MKIHTLFFINILFIFLLNSCSYFDEEEDKILPGKKEKFLFLKDQILKKANKKVKILAQKRLNLGNNNIKMLEIIYFILKVTQS